MSHVFGPVPSRRLGRSLGVDVVPLKTCTYDCLYCQIGRTTSLAVEGEAWVQVDAVVAEVAAKLGAQPDYITLSGSGEPTLYPKLGELIAAIKQRTDIPVAVLTNGSLLWREEIRTRLLHADLVVPSLDAGNESTWRAVNRPHPSLDFATMLQGLIDFREAFAGAYWLEVLLLAGYTDSPDAVRAIAECAERIHPDRIQLNTVTRPPADATAQPISPERMAEFAAMFRPPAEVIADFKDVHGRPEFVAERDDVLTLLARRPCSIEDIAAGLGIHRNEAVKHVESLLSDARIVASAVGDTTYYQPA